MFGNNNPLATEITGQDTTVYMEARHIINAEKIIKFYIGQLVEIVAVYLMDFKGSHSVTDKRFSYLAETLEKLKPDVQNDMLAKGFITEKYNEFFKKDETPQAIGHLLKNAGLSSTNTRKWINGKYANCMIWDEKTDKFLKTMGSKGSRVQTLDNKGVEREPIKNTKRSKGSKKIF